MPCLQKQNATHLNLLHSRRHWRAPHNPPTSCLIIVRSRIPSLKCRTIHTSLDNRDLDPQFTSKGSIEGHFEYVCYLACTGTYSFGDHILYAFGWYCQGHPSGRSASCLGSFRPEFMHVKDTQNPRALSNTRLGITSRVYDHHLNDENVSMKNNPKQLPHFDRFNQIAGSR